MTANTTQTKVNSGDYQLTSEDILDARPMSQSFRGEPEHVPTGGEVEFENPAYSLPSYQGDVRSTWSGTANQALALIEAESKKKERQPAESNPSVDAGEGWQVGEKYAPTTKAYEYLEDSTPFNTSRVNTYGNRVTTHYPYRAIGKLFFNTEAGPAHCSGALIGPSLVLTAAHCVSEYGGDFYQSFAFAPAYDNGEEPFGRWNYEKVTTSSSYVQGTSPCAAPGIGCANDVALIRLETRTDRKGKQYRLGEKIGWLGVGMNGWGFNDNGYSIVTLVSQFGYPGSHDGGDMMQRTDSQARYEPETDMAVTSSRQTQGASGGPWVSNFGQHAELSDGITLGSYAKENRVLAVTSALDGTGKVYASWLNDNNFTFLYDELCAEDSSTCEYSSEVIENPAIRVNLEEPINGQTYSGVGNLRGWALYEFGVLFLEVYIDGEYAFRAPYGAARSDVGNAFPNIAASEYSGFGLTFNYGNLSPGEHEIAVIAVTRTGEAAITRSTFFVDGYHKPFIAPSDEVSVDGAGFVGDGDRVELLDVMVDGRAHNLTLEWQTATQSFSTVAIETAD